ncbi:MAG: twitching motility protein PilT, partial [Frankiaceae bacterium]|nr:twitching motility protein PilT [Frankiaceae bacterium]
MDTHAQAGTPAGAAPETAPGVLTPLDPQWRPDAPPAQTYSEPAAAPPPPAPAPAAAPAPTATLSSFATPLPGDERFQDVTETAPARTAIEEDSREEGIFLNDLLVRVLESGGSDLHLTAGAKPTIRVNGHLIALDEYPVLTPPGLQKMLYAIITQKQRERFEEELELDFAYAVPGKARFRTNIYRQRDAVGGAFRLIPYEIKPLETLGIPPAAANFAMLPRGFVLVTGPTGSGKSTTLASLLDLSNRQRKDHIMTVEDPIEFLHHHRSCLVNQREVGEDTHSFQNALKHVLRQDPDIILVGEMRDLETISVALTAAETGHLVFATLHTQDAAQTIDRIIDVFPAHQQQQVRVQLAGALQGIVAQQLCRTA